MKKKYILNPKCIDCDKELANHYAQRCHSCARKELYKDKTKHPMYGKIGKKHHHFGKIGELATNWKGGKPKCINCNKLLSDYNAKRCRSCEIKYLFQIGKLNTKGNNNGNWNGGKSFEPYSLEWTKELKESIRKRDNYDCQNCGMTEEEHLIVIGKVLCIHHIDYNKKNCTKNNLITLCHWCNLRANLNRDYWKEYYQIKMEVKNGTN